MENKVVHLLTAANKEHEEERMQDKRERLVLVGIILCTLLFGALCFDLGFRVGTALCS